MRELEYWLGFAKLFQIGSIPLYNIWEYFGSMKTAWHASNSDWLHFEKLKFSTIQNFPERKAKINLAEIVKDIQNRDLTVLTIENEDYPQILKEIPVPPAILFAKGDLKSCNLEKSLAIVGSRKASNYALSSLREIISGLRGENITIVSGMALGIDGCAHSAALENNLKTIAVLGCGVDVIYPRQNTDIYKKIIAGGGAVISEFYPDEEPLPFKFPMRNRIISGLAQGTLIAEAHLKSGALITGRTALEQNREIMCLPGLITNPNTAGTHKLLKEGACLVTSVNDILNNLNWQSERVCPNMDKNSGIVFLDNEAKIYEILKLEPKNIDEIANITKIDIGEIMVSITTMELNGYISQLPGGQYTKSGIN